MTQIIQEFNMTECSCANSLLVKSHLSLKLASSNTAESFALLLCSYFYFSSIALVLLKFLPHSLFVSFQAEHLTSCYWGGSSNPTERHDPSLPYLEQYRIDVEQFKGLFNLLFPWANGAHSDPLAMRFFRLLDQNGDALINFREFISGLGR